jgi:hypothetical protein|mmetsp:Transcript_14752/g.2448  ORF Transcript_14752/g.2448 Transcript_14752/m.2448 type:complete len:95 (-) Transcript_14752:619-903(-)
MVTQFGISILMVIFVNSNMIQIMEHYGGPKTVFLHLGVFALFVIPLCLVRQLHKLAITHLLADLFMILALGYYLVISSLRLGTEGPAEGVQPAN